MSRHGLRYLLGLLVGIGLLFAVSRFINSAAALEKFGAYPWEQLSLILVLSLLYYLLKALRWQFLLRAVDIRLPLRRSLLLYLAGQWFAVTPAGEFVRAYLLTRFGFSFSRGSAVVVVQVILDFLSLAIIGSISVIWYRELAMVVLPFTAILFLGTLAFAYAPSMGTGQRLSVLSRVRSHAGPKWRDFFQHSRQLMGWRCLFIGLDFGLLTVLVGAAVLLEVSLGYEIPASLGQSAYIYSISQLVGGLSMLPHGLGAIEGTSVALFHYAGVDTAYAASATVLFRLATVGWGMILGGIALLALRTPLAGPHPPKQNRGPWAYYTGRPPPSPYG